jgi:hypothetical protein
MSISAASIRKPAVGSVQVSQKIKCLLNLLLVALLLYGRYAEASPTDAAERMPAKKIESAILSYAKSLGCNESFNRKNIVELPSSYGLGESKYLVLYYLDVGCDGGSTSEASYFGVLTQSFGGRIYVDGDLSRPSATDGFPSNIASIQRQGNKVVYIGKQYDFSKDAMCCPSVVVKGIVDLAGSGSSKGRAEDTQTRWVARPF